MFVCLIVAIHVAGLYDLLIPRCMCLSSSPEPSIRPGRVTISGTFCTHFSCSLLYLFSIFRTAPSGTGYYGLQIQLCSPSIEGQLLLAALKAHAIRETNAVHAGRFNLQRTGVLFFSLKQ